MGFSDMEPEHVGSINFIHGIDKTFFYNADRRKLSEFVLLHNRFNCFKGQREFFGIFHAMEKGIKLYKTCRELLTSSYEPLILKNLKSFLFHSSVNSSRTAIPRTRFSIQSSEYPFA